MCVCVCVCVCVRIGGRIWVSENVGWDCRLENEEEKRLDVYLLYLLLFPLSCFAAWRAGGGVALGTRQRQEKPRSLPRVERHATCTLDSDRD